MTKRIMWACAGAAAVVWWEIILWVLVGYVVFWLWFFLGSRNHCPNCGRSRVDDLPGTRCSCGE